MNKFLLIIDGPMGAGKTTVAKILHEKIKHTAHIGLDRIKWIVSGFQRTPMQNEMTRSVVLEMTKEYLHQGVNVIVEQGMKTEQLAIYKKLARKNKAGYLVIRLNASKEVLFERVRQRLPSPGKPKVSNARILRNYRVHLANKHSEGFEIDTEKKTPKEIANYIFKELKAL